MPHRTRNIFTLLVGALLLSVAAGAAPIAASGDNDAMLRDALDGSWRSAANKARDQYRHPAETLAFFAITPDMTVIELDPGSGWYTEILAPFLYDRGHLIEASAPAKDGKTTTKFETKLASDPAVYGHIAKVIPFAPPQQVNLGADDSADLVLTFRSAHDWMNHDPQTLMAVFGAAFKVLKSGGVFGLVEHRAKPFANAPQSAKALHRFPEDFLIEAGLKSGFRLGGVAQINANSKDPEDVNVHRLLPDLSGPAAEHARMKGIGESDRMTLKFVKP